MLTEAQHRFLCSHRVARFASADASGTPHVVPVCFCYEPASAYFSIDEKPKQKNVRGLKRIRNLLANPAVVLMVDRYDEDWNKLGWLMLHGAAELLENGDEHRRIQAALRNRYPQLRAMRIEDKPVVAIRVQRVAAWGNMDVDCPAASTDQPRAPAT